jgi:uncharacterized protein YPO0396
VKLVTFTVAEANRALQEVRPRMEKLVKAKAEFDRLQSRLQVLELAMAGASEDNPDAREHDKLAQRRGQLAESISVRHPMGAFGYCPRDRGLLGAF